VVLLLFTRVEPTASSPDLHPRDSSTSYTSNKKASLLHRSSPWPKIRCHCYQQQRQHQLTSFHSAGTAARSVQQTFNIPLVAGGACGGLHLSACTCQCIQTPAHTTVAGVTFPDATSCMVTTPPCTVASQLHRSWRHQQLRPVARGTSIQICCWWSSCSGG
jgi:hypothetical protein